MASGISTDFYLGANSPNGFYSLYDWLIDLDSANDVFIIKGGAGCGKSSFMRHIASKLIDCGVDIEYLHCSSDPDSLDGIVMKQLSAAFVDGTYPHVVEPKYPGVVESYVNLGCFYDADALGALKTDIIAATHAYKNGYSTAYRCLSAAKSLTDDVYSQVLGAVDFKRLNRRIKGICQRELKRKGKHKSGAVQKRFLSAISPKGYACDFSTVSTLCGRVYELKSNYGLSGLMLSAFQNTALENGYDVIACYSPMYPEGTCEHLIIPELSLGFVTSTDLIPYDKKAYRRILIDNTIDKAKLKPVNTRIRYSRRMTKSLIDEAVSSLAQVKANHDRLELLYNPHVDFDGVYDLADKYACKLIERL